MINSQPIVVVVSGNCDDASLKQTTMDLKTESNFDAEDLSHERDQTDLRGRDESSPSSRSTATANLFRPFSRTSPTPIPINEALISAFSPVSRLLSFRPFHPPVTTSSLFQPFAPNPIHQSVKPVSRCLPFSVDNILRPNFGQRSRIISTSSSCCSSPFLTSPPPPGSHTSSPIKDEPKSADDSAGVDLTCPRGKASKSSQGEDSDDGVPPGMVRGPNGQLWLAWVFCTRYSDRPSSGECAHQVILYCFLSNVFR